jgi:hypothetical protein
MGRSVGRTFLAGLLLSLLAGSILVSTTAAEPPPIKADDVTAEATSAAGASVTYHVTAYDFSNPSSPTPITATCDPPGTGGSGDFDVTANFPLGDTSVTCTTTAPVYSKTFTVHVVDTTPPSVPQPPNATASTTDPAGTAVSWDPVTATDTVDGSIVAVCTPGSGSTFPVGTSTVTCSATDAHGNTGSKSFSVTVTFTDTEAPTFTSVPGPINVEAPGPVEVTYSVSATDNSGNPPTIECTPPSGSTFPIGTTTVNCTAKDGSGNTASASFTVTVVFIDNVAPTFSGVPSNRVVEANGPTGSTVNYPTPTATDNVDGPIAVVTCSPASGSTFPLGTTTVTCSATDSHGNTGTASFSVTVVDTTKPSLVVPADRSVYADTPSGIDSQSGAVAGFLSGASATDTVDPHPVVTHDAPSFLTVGTHVVTFTARDASGNTVSKTATLDVLPMPAPGTPPPPPLPVPPARKPPADVKGLKADAGDGLVRLSWQTPAGVDHVVVNRSLTVGGDEQVVYTGSGQTFTDRGVANGLEYRYLVVSVNANGDASAGVAVVALPKQTLLRSPKDGARLQKPPKLVWLANTEASYYNVQLYRGSVKTLSAWPVKANLVLQKKWKFQGRKYTLTAGVYRWYVWPGFGARAAANYGEMLGFSSFTIVR